MVQRKFKHKNQPIWAVQCGTNSETFGIETDDRKLETSVDKLEGEHLSRRYLEKSPDWEEITGLVEGRWYMADANGIFKTVGRYHYIESKDDTHVKLFDCYRFECYKFECSNVPAEVYNRPQWIARERITREATYNEIHQALEAIRIEKGLVGGVNIYGTTAGLKRQISQYPKITYDYYNDIAFISVEDGEGEVISLYEAGKWATKIEPKLVTRDNFSVEDGDSVWVVDKRNWHVFKQSVYKNLDPNDSSWYFYVKNNAVEFAEEYKPRYSKADLERLEYEASKIKKPWEEETEVIRSFKKMIQNLKQSKR